MDKDLIIFRFPVQSEKSFAQVLYQKEFRRLRKEGVSTRAEMEETLKSRGIWGNQQEIELNKLNKQLEEEVKIHRIFKSKKEQPYEMTIEDSERYMIEILSGERMVYLDEEREKLIESQKPSPQEELFGVARSIDIIENEITKLQAKRTEFMKETAERLAAEAKLHWYISQCAMNSNRASVWTYEEFRTDRNAALVAFAVREYGDFLSGLDTRVLRFLARTAFRTLWVTATKTSTPIFSGRTIDWNPNQVALCHYSMMYDAIYGLSSSERPPDYIIERDGQLDDWLQKRHEEEEKERRGNAGGVMDMEEVLITPASPLFQEFKEQGLFDDPKKKLGKKEGSTFTPTAKNRR